MFACLPRFVGNAGQDVRYGKYHMAWRGWLEFLPLTPSNARRPTIYSVCLELVLRRLCNVGDSCCPNLLQIILHFPDDPWHGTEQVRVSPFRMSVPLSVVRILKHRPPPKTARSIAPTSSHSFIVSRSVPI